ncbi:MAG: hypothetical protein IPN29_04150 [Saprospiraceae bacterium]|nr:hypothetical protein [Saprospiraceae bacterium]
MIKSLTQMLLLAFIMLINLYSYGQKEVHLQINQYIGNAPFSIGDMGTNDQGTKFTITRIDYYISSIQLHHDGGMTTNVNNKYIFVTKGKAVDELLGSFNIGLLDSITFSVGVDSPNNHGDPTLWPANHPLAPKSPEMQWGWAAGYRFVAIEGKSGANLQFEYQIHALGDELYNPTTIVTHGTNHNGVLMVAIDADYEKSLKGINMNKNVIQHGSAKEAVSLMSNYNQNVFKATEGISASHEIEVGSLKIYPNPVIDGKVTIALTEDQILNSNIIIRDAVGRIALQISKPTTLNEISVERSGFYSIELIQAGNITYRAGIVKQ